MGQSATIKQPKLKLHFFQTFPQHYKAVDLQNYNVYGQGQAYQTYLESELVFERNYFVKNEDDESAIETCFEMQEEIDSDGIIRIYAQREKSGRGFCQSYNQIQVYYEFIPYTLFEEIAARQNSRRIFSESEIWYLALHICQILTSLKNSGYNHKDIRPTTILLRPFGQIKLAPIGLFIDDKNSIQKYILYQIPTYLPSEVKSQLAISQLKEIDWDEIDSYALGITLLNVANCSNEHYSTREQIEASIQNIKSNYSQKLSVLLQYILLTDRQNRLNVSDLFVIMYPYNQFILHLSHFNIDFLQLQNQKNPLNKYGQSRINAMINHLEESGISLQQLSSQTLQQPQIQLANSMTQYVQSNIRLPQSPQPTIRYQMPQYQQLIQAPQYVQYIRPTVQPIVSSPKQQAPGQVIDVQVQYLGKSRESQPSQYIAPPIRNSNISAPSQNSRQPPQLYPVQQSIYQTGQFPTPESKNILSSPPTQKNKQLMDKVNHVLDNSDQLLRNKQG